MNIKQLRQTILDRAIRGQLVSQDPTDEPASVLLERIRAEKEELIKEKKLKREKRESQPIEEVPFEIPEGWVWCRLGEVCFFKGGYAFKSNKYIEKSNNQVIRIGNVKNNNLILSNQPVYVPDTLQNEIEDYHIKENDLLFTMTGTKGKRDYFYTLVVPKVKHNLYLNQRVGLLRVILSELNIYFINLVLKHQFVLDSIFQTETGNVNQGNIGSENTLNLLIPLPPLAEQKRIVQKIEQLFALVDIIEVNKKALEKLIEQAKNQVLSDAIAGKLTRQDPNDEPAEELLKRIGKTTAPDTPYEKLPKGWAWCKLGDLSEFIRNGISIKQDKGLKGYPITRIETISDGSINRERMGYADIYDISKYEQYLLTKGDILLSHINSPIHIGKSAVYTPISDEEKIIHGMNLLCIRLKEVDSCFINYFFNSKTFRYSLFPFIKHAVNQASINIGNLRNIYISLPPLAEQHRIVQQIEMYFAAFDKIKNELI